MLARLHRAPPTLYYGVLSSASVHFTTPPVPSSTPPVMRSRPVENHPEITARVFAVVDLLHIPRTLSNSLTHSHVLSVGSPRARVRLVAPHTYIMQFLSLPMLDSSLCVCFEVLLMDGAR